MMAVTPAGKFLRKKRIDRSESLREMSEGIGVSPTYLSVIEHGEKAITDRILARMIKYLNLDSAEQFELERLVLVSRPSLKISLKESSDKARTLALIFARKLNELSDDQIRKIRDVLDWGRI